MDSTARPERSADSPVRARDSRLVWFSSKPSLLALALFLVGLILYLPSLSQDFMWYDDPIYVIDNHHVTTGVTWPNLIWAFTSLYAANWHPLTWCSHMVDCQLFGLRPWGHHLTNSVLHGLNMAAVFLALRRLTGATWRSFAVALLFGVHPLQVQSAAWISERKNLLSTLFWMLSLWAYAKYASRERGARASCRQDAGAPSSRWKFYCLALLFCCLGLMSKPMVVTAPFLLLVLDWWPLGRWERHQPLRLLVEKIPFLFAALGCAAVTFSAQGKGGAVQSGLPLVERLENAVAAYCLYLKKAIFPVDLAVFYPRVPNWSPGVVAAAALLLLLVSLGVLLARRRHPEFLTGWLWFLGTLAPVIGLVQAGDQSMADRYFYVPGIGVLIILVWGATACLERWKTSQWFGTALVTFATLALFAVSCWQLRFWRDTETLFRRAIDVTQSNYLAHHILGVGLEKRGLLDQAIAQFNESLRESPTYADAHNSLGLTLQKTGQSEQAIAHYRQAIALRPGFTDPHFNLAVALGAAGHAEEAAAEYEIVLRLDPNAADAHNNLGFLYDKQGGLDQAVFHYQQAIRLNPAYARAHFNLGVALTREGRLDEAISEFETALKIKPDYAEAKFNLAAVQQAQQETPRR